MALDWAVHTSDALRQGNIITECSNVGIRGQCGNPRDPWKPNHCALVPISTRVQKQALIPEHKHPWSFGTGPV